MPRVALVTGANGGIGRVLVARFEEAGIAVAALDLDPSVGALASDVDGARVHPIVVDLTDVAAIEDALGEVADVLGPVDVLVNNAGVMHKKA
ncbi:MAG TPA: SDR family NAD(P)-dependent oxidoreductase, partial [Acidimicrobiia bacterium]|nr:SDR family NAD(P)-dependent oxidoreductase [Acidimicrobiia bacterium]